MAGESSTMRFDPIALLEVAIGHAGGLAAGVLAYLTIERPLLLRMPRPETRADVPIPVGS